MQLDKNATGRKCNKWIFFYPVDPLTLYVLKELLARVWNALDWLLSLRSWTKMKNPPKFDLKNREIDWLYICLPQYELHTINGNRNLANLLKFAGKNSWNHSKSTYTWRVLDVWNHCALLPYSLYLTSLAFRLCLYRGVSFFLSSALGYLEIAG